MFLFKTHQNVQALSSQVGLRHLKRFSSGISCNSTQELSEPTLNEDKILTDQFREQLPYIQEMDKKSPQSYKLNQTSKELLKAPFSEEITNVLDLATEITEITASGSNTKNSSGEISGDSIQGKPTECPLTNAAVENECLPPKSLPVLISSFDMKKAGSQWDLTTASLPISLHRTEGNLLIVAVNKDIQRVYCKTLETTEYCWMVVQQQGSLLRKIVGLPEESGMIGRITRERALVLVEKSALWLTDPKPAPKESKTEVSFIDSIKKGIHQILTALKSKLEEQKKAVEKKEEVKKRETDKGN